MFKELAKVLYSTFIINSSAIGIQKYDGTYRTYYLKYGADLIEKVLEKEESVMIYQQQLGTDLVKWICLDYDCISSDKIVDLYEDHIKKITQLLEDKKISYLLEFSGRRGIHVWILFDNVIRKSLAFKIGSKIAKSVNQDNGLFKLDMFPKTSSAIGNKVGSGVKLPLSKHKKSNKYSYFIKGINDITKYENDQFVLTEQEIDNQLSIIKSVPKNDVDYIIAALEVDSADDDLLLNYKRHSSNSNDDVDLDELILNLRKCKAYDDLFCRMFSGLDLTNEDRFILLGTLGHIKPNGIDALLQLLRYFPNFDESTSKDRIKELRGYYYPPTMGYVHSKLDVICNCCGESIELSVLEFLKNKCSMPIEIEESVYKTNISNNTIDLVRVVSSKEKNYMRYNDEVTDLLIYNNLSSITLFHEYQITEIIEKIKRREDVELNGNPIVYIRNEGNGKTRRLVTLQAVDRIVTTAIALKMTLLADLKYDSYSYNVTPFYGRDVFYSWSTSWKKWNNRIKTYLDLELFEDYKMLKIDIKAFYDSIFMSQVVDEIKEILSKKANDNTEMNNLLDYLVNYNEKIMNQVNGSVRGVPQGPAYARIIAEYHLLVTFSEIRKKYNEVEWLRYVDDIYVFANPNFDIKELKREIEELLSFKSLQLSDEKTLVCEALSELTPEQKEEMYNFYDFRNMVQTQLNSTQSLSAKEFMVLERKIETFLNRDGEFNINDLNFFLSERIDDKLRSKLIIKYSEIIFSSEIGRGSVFSKLYNYIFSNEVLLLWFKAKEMYKYIPIKSLNFKCFVSELFLNLEEYSYSALSLLSDEVICYIESLSDIEASVLIATEALKRKIVVVRGEWNDQY